VFLSLLEISLDLRLLTAKYLLGLRGQVLMLYDTFSMTGTMHKYKISFLIIVWVMSLSGSQVVTILTHVRDAMLATPTAPISKLVLVEMMLSQTSSRFTHTTSLQLLALNGGITRTQGKCVLFILHFLSTVLRFKAQFYALIEKAGFIVQSVTEIRGVDLILELKPRCEIFT